MIRPPPRPGKLRRRKRLGERRAIGRHSAGRMNRVAREAKHGEAATYPGLETRGYNGTKSAFAPPSRTANAAMAPFPTSTHPKIRRHPEAGHA
jgi:hypothetical protein